MNGTNKICVDSGLIVSTAFISPIHEDREIVRKLFDDKEFIEVFENCPLGVCEDEILMNIKESVHKILSV